MSHFLASVSLLVFANLVARETVFASFLDDNKIARCDPRTTLPGYGILVTHGMPSPHNGNVVLKSMMNKSLSYADPSCAWSYTVYDHNVVTGIKSGTLAYGLNINWIFSKSGLRKVSVTTQFKYWGDDVTIKNCTFVNVTGECRLNSLWMSEEGRGGGEDFEQFET